MLVIGLVLQCSAWDCATIPFGLRCTLAASRKNLAENAQQEGCRPAAKQDSGALVLGRKGVSMGTPERRYCPSCSSGKHASPGGCLSWGEMK